jgi:hypothetical protein
MNHSRIILAVPALVLGGIALTTSEASARVPEEPPSSSVQPSAPDPEYAPRYEVPLATTATVTRAPDDSAAEAVQAGASALAGAALALGGVWTYRRLQLRAG